MKATELDILSKFGILPDWVFSRWNNGEARNLSSYLGWLTIFRVIGILLAIIGFVCVVLEHATPPPPVWIPLTMMCLGLIVRFFGNRPFLGRDLRKLSSAIGVSICRLIEISNQDMEILCHQKLAYQAAFIMKAEEVLGINDPRTEILRAKFKRIHKAFQNFSFVQASYNPYYEAAKGITLNKEDVLWLEEQAKVKS